MGKLVSTRSVPSQGLARCSGLYKQMDLVFCLFLTGVREVTKPADISTADATAKLPNYGHIVFVKYKTVMLNSQFFPHSRFTCLTLFHLNGVFWDPAGMNMSIIFKSVVRRCQYFSHNLQLHDGCSEKYSLGISDLEMCWRQCLGVFKDPIYALTEVFMFKWNRVKDSIHTCTVYILWHCCCYPMH